jgi:malate dehydrogenase (oxaloacetate-decarboxylating)(NADP+)
MAATQPVWAAGVYDERSRGASFVQGFLLQRETIPMTARKPPAHSASLPAVSLHIATAVAEIAFDQGLAQQPKPADLPDYIESLMYRPAYPQYVEEADDVRV